MSQTGGNEGEKKTVGTSGSEMQEKRWMRTTRRQNSLPTVEQGFSSYFSVGLTSLFT